VTKRAELADGRVLEFPDDTPFEVIQRVVREQTAAGQAPAPAPAPAPTPAPVAAPPKERPGFLDYLQSNTTDYIARPLKGLLGGVEMGTNIFGADNPVSDILRGAQEGINEYLVSDTAKQKAEERSKRLEGKGFFGTLAEVPGIVADDPALLAETLGTALPSIGAALLTGGSSAGVQTAAMLGTGAVMGGGAIKGSIYNATKDELMRAGTSEEEAEQAASEAQSYAGENLDMIALGATIGAIASRTGIEPTAARLLAGRVVGKSVGQAAGREALETALRQSAQKGAQQGAIRTAVGEATLEGTQGAQEKLAANLALRRQGMDVDLMEGVGSAAALEGTLGGILGGGLGVAGRQTGTQEATALAADPAIRAEFQRLASQEVAAIMQANPELDENAAVDLVSERAEELLTRAAVNVVGAEGETDVAAAADTAVDVLGGGVAGVAPDLGVAPPVAGAPDLGEAVTGRLGEPLPSVPVPDVGTRAGEPALAPVTAAQVKATVPTIEQVFADNSIDFEDGFGVKKLNAEQKKQAARIVLQSPEVDPYDAIGSVLERGQRLRGEPVAPKTMQPMGQRPGTFRTVTDINGQQTTLEGLTPTPKLPAIPAAPSIDEVAVAPVKAAIEAAAAPAPVVPGAVPSLAQASAREVGITPTPVAAAPNIGEKSRTYNQASSDFDAGLITRDEFRAKVGLPPVEPAPPVTPAVAAVEKAAGLPKIAQSLQPGDVVTTDIGDTFTVTKNIPLGESGDSTLVGTWDNGNEAVVRASEFDTGFTPQPYIDTATGERKMGKPWTVQRAAPSATITPAPPPTPQQIVDDLEGFGIQEAENRNLNVPMFREGIRDIKLGLEPVPDQLILDTQGPDLLDAYKAGQQWARERIAEAQAAPTQAAGEADIDPVILKERTRLLNKLKKAPGKTMRQKIFWLMNKEAEKALKDINTPEEAMNFLGLDETSPMADEVLRGKAGINRERMLDMLRKQYKGAPKDMGHVTVKEILQNSHDAVRDALRLGLTDRGKIEFTVSPDGYTFTTKDNGKGMSPEVLRGPFLEVGSTGKGAAGEQHSGGYGLAKTLFLYGNEAINVITASDGVVSTLDTHGEQLAIAAATGDPEDQPLIRYRPFTEADYAMFPEGHGTLLELTLPMKDVDPESGEEIEVKALPDFPYSSDLPGLVNSPLFSPVDVTYNGYRVDIGNRFPLDEFAEFASVQLPSGIAYIYASREPKKYAGWSDNMHVLSDGVWQFSRGINKPNDAYSKLPYDFFINYVADPSIKPDNPLYPFTMDRKNFSETGQKSYESLASILLEAYGLSDLYSEVKSFGTVRYFDPSTGKLGTEVDLTPEIPEIKTGFEDLKNGSAIAIGTDGRVAINGGEKLDPAALGDLKKNLPKASSLRIDQSKIDSKRIMVHENADVEYTDADGETQQKPIMDFLRDTFGDKIDDFYFYMGNAFQQLRDEVAEVMEYPALKTEAVGISVDPGYRGVSIKVPFSGMFINPLIPEAKAGPRALFGIVTTMVHELAHYRVRNHDAGFPAEMQRIQSALEAAAYEQGFDFPAWKQRFVARAIDAGFVDIIEAGQQLFEAEKDVESYTYGNPDFKNIRVIYRGQRFKDGAAEQVPEQGGAGPDGTPDIGEAGRGEGAGERVLGAAYESRRGAGERGEPAGSQGGTEPVTDANVDKVVSAKLTKAQIKRLEEAAGIRRMKLSNMQRRIVKSRSAEETLNLTGKLMLLARRPNADVNLLTSLYNSVPPPLLQKLLGPMMTDDVVRLAERAGMKNISEIDKMIRDEYTPYINSLMQAASTVSERWTDFASRFEDGNQALADVMYIANMYDVDPTLASSAGEYAKVDTKMRELTANLAAEKDTKKKSVLKGQISRRRGEIQRVYYGGADPDTGAQVYGWNDLSDAKLGGGAGKRIFRLARDHYRNTFEEHYRLLMERIDTSKFENKKAVELKSAVDDMFTKARERSIYFPLKRFGEYWVSVGKGQNSEFYLFESLGDQQDFIDRIKAEGETRFIDFSQGKDTLRNGLRSKAADASAALKNILDKIEGDNITDVDVLKDNIFQMYLMALPEADMRRRFIHREFKTGFSTDALRTFASSAVASASQLGRLAYNYKLKNLIEASYAETAGNRSKARLDTLTREIEWRVESIMSPDVNDWFEHFVSVNAKGTFLFFLSGVKSAVMNLTQLHIVGLPTLAAEFGEKATAGMAARYTAELLTGKRMAVPFRDEDGNVRLEFPKFTAEDSAYIRGLQETDPDRYAAMQKAWEYSKTHDVTESTFTSGADIYERSNTPTGEFGAVQALRRGEVLTATQRATGNAINALGGLFHSTERIGREIMYMSAFELAYERNLKEGMAPVAAGDAAMVQADKLTRDAMFDFTNWNKSRYSKAPAGRLALQMRSYSITMSSLLFRSFYGMLPYFNKEGKAAAAKVFFGIGAMTALYGGFRATQFSALGMLGYGLYEMLKSAFEDDDEEEEVEQGYLNPETLDRELMKYADEQGRELTKKDMEYYTRAVWIPETFGPKGTLATKLGIPDAAAEKLETVADIGLPGLFGVDLSSSVSLGDLWHPVTTKADDPEVRLFEFLGRSGAGATGSMYAAFLKSWKQFNEGDLDKAIETGMPALTRNFVKANRLGEEGLVVGKDRDIVLRDPSFYDVYTLGMQALGFPEAKTSRAMQLDIQAGDIEREVAQERTDLLNKRYRAILDTVNNPSEDGDRQLRAIERDIDIYNLNYPSNAITKDTKEQSFKQKAEEAGERMYGLGINPKIPIRQPLVEERAEEFMEGP